MLTINSKKTNITTITINNNPIEHISEFKYLGNVINSNANNKSLISQRTKNVYNKMLGIAAICKEIGLGQYELHVLIRLYHAIFLSTFFFNCRTWARIRKYDIGTLSVVQLNYLKQALRVPYLVAYLEMGYVVDIKRLVYFHHILMLTNDEPMKNLYYQQLDLAFEENWANEIHHLAKQYSIIVEEDSVKSLSREKWKAYITNKITEYGLSQLKS